MRARYCLDTDVVSAVIRSQPDLRLLGRMAGIRAECMCTTAITLGEIVYGAIKRGRPALVERVLTMAWSVDAFLPFDSGAAHVYASVRADLERQGSRLDEPDLRIAAIALSRDLTIITGNVRHFGRVPRLRVENWLTPEE
jgi:tRNA(fMet)-specific endonuclease VapC